MTFFREPSSPGGDERTSGRGTLLRRLAAAVYVLAVLAATLVPVAGIGWEPSDLSFCIICGVRGTADALLNVLLFVPVGALLVRDLGAGRTVILGGLLSLAIETIQLWIPGRYTAASDLLFNTTGAGIGALLGGLPFTALLTAASAPSPASSAALPGASSAAAGRGKGGDVQRLARRLAVGWTLGAALFLVATGFLLRTSVTDAPLYGQWTPDLGGGVYGGRILEATVGGMPVGSRRVEDQAHLRSLLEEDAPLEVRFVAGPPPRIRAPVFNVFDGDRQAILSLAADGRDLVFYRRYVADDLRLDRPDLRMAGGFGGVAEGDTVRVRVAGSAEGGFRVTMAEAGSADRAASESANRTAPRREATLFHTPARSWALFLYSGEGPPTLRSVMDLLWLVLLGFPLGLWAPSLRGGSLLMGTLLVALVSSAALSPLITVPIGQLAILAAGVLLGRAFRLAIATWRPPGESASR